MIDTARRPFPVRFLGRPWFWLYLLVFSALTGGLFFYWRSSWVEPRAALPLHEGRWFLWSGVVVGGMYGAAYVFSLRKWSIKLRFFRDLGHRPEADLDELWSRLQQLNRMIVGGRVSDPRDVRERAEQILARTGTAGVRKLVIERKDLGQGRVLTLVSTRPREPLGRLEPWLEVHAALGAVGCVASLVHADFALHSPLGWWMTSLSFVVLVTGAFGLVLYRIGPPLLVRASFGIPFEEARVACEDLDRCARASLAQLGPHWREGLPALQRGSAGAGWNQAARKLLDATPAEQQEVARDVLVLAGIHRSLWEAARPSRRIDFQLRVWRWVHVPAALLLLGAVLVHVLTVLVY